MPPHPDPTLAAIKNAVDIVALAGEYLTLHRSGSRFKVLCPFHDDHNPSLELNQERQSFKCWSCGAGGDVFDFVKQIERVEFPEAKRMLAERAGVALDTPTDRGWNAPKGPSKADLRAVVAWAEGLFAEELSRSPEIQSYVASRGISAESVDRFHTGYAPDQRDWLSSLARRDGFRIGLLEQSGLVAKSAETGMVRDRFRGRLIFPIHDFQGRPIGFGGRILPEVEKKWHEAGKGVAKYVNTPETPLFQKRRQLYAADLARPAARKEGWVAVVEGYTDVIAAHQAGLTNCVGTMGTALTADHMGALRQLADRAVLVFDGDEAGQRAADRSLELFLAHQIDVRVLTMPEGLDPADFLNQQGADAFRALVDRAVDPLDFAIDRVASQFDFRSPEGARQAAEVVLGLLAHIPRSNRVGLDLKVSKALDTLSHRLGLPLADLKRTLRQLQRRPARPSPAQNSISDPGSSPAVSELEKKPIRVADLDRLGCELVRIALNEPGVVGRLITQVAPNSLTDAPLRVILQACYDVHAEGHVPSFDLVVLRLDDPAVKGLASALLLPPDPAPLPEGVRPASWEARLAGALTQWGERLRKERLRDLKEALGATNRETNPEGHRALQTEYLKLSSQRPDDLRKKSAS